MAHALFKRFLVRKNYCCCFSAWITMNNNTFWQSLNLIFLLFMTPRILATNIGLTVVLHWGSIWKSAFSEKKDSLTNRIFTGEKNLKYEGKLQFGVARCEVELQTLPFFVTATEILKITILPAMFLPTKLFTIPSRYVCSLITLVVVGSCKESLFLTSNHIAIATL